MRKWLSNKFRWPFFFCDNFESKKVNNYIYFNCSDYSKQDDTTCERWRIVGVFDGRVKIIRDEKYESNIGGIYPCGEGAGYAGGIVSSAVDGERCAESAFEFINSHS
mgnify:CR=1 FL=1